MAKLRGKVGQSGRLSCSVCFVSITFAVVWYLLYHYHCSNRSVWWHMVKAQGTPKEGGFFALANVSCPQQEKLPLQFLRLSSWAFLYVWLKLSGWWVILGVSFIFVCFVFVSWWSPSSKVQERDARGLPVPHVPPLRASCAPAVAPAPPSAAAAAFRPPFCPMLSLGVIIYFYWILDKTTIEESGFWIILQPPFPEFNFHILFFAFPPILPPHFSLTFSFLPFKSSLAFHKFPELGSICQFY